jgi:hypothetical protein
VHFRLRFSPIHLAKEARIILPFDKCETLAYDESHRACLAVALRKLLGERSSKTLVTRDLAELELTLPDRPSERVTR